MLSYPPDSLLAILVAMSSKSKVEVPGALSDAGDSPYGEPLTIRQHPDQGIIVRLHTGVEVYLNIRDHGHISRPYDPAALEAIVDEALATVTSQPLLDHRRITPLVRKLRLLIGQLQKRE